MSTAPSSESVDPPGAPAAPDAASMKARVISSTKASLVGRVVSQGIRLAANLVLARLLTPADFGLMALVMVVLQGLEMLSDVGTRLAIINHPRGEERVFLDTAFTIECVRGVGLWVVGLIAAYPVSLGYGEPRLLSMIPVATLVTVISGFGSTKIHLLNRRIELRRVVLIDLGSQLVGSLAMVAAAFAWRNVWALLVNALVVAATRFVLGHFWLPGPRNRFAFDRAIAREILGAGRWVAASTLTSFLSQRLDILILGTLVSLNDLGLYNQANVLANLPMLITGQAIGTVLMPAIAESNRRGPEALRAAFARALDTVLPTVGVICVGVILVAPPFFTILYDPRYHASGPIAQLMMSMVWFGFCQEITSRTLLAIGEARSLTASNIVKLSVTALACWGGFTWLGLPGFIFGAAVGVFSGFAVMAWRLEAGALPVLRQTVTASAVGIAASAAIILAPAPLAESLGVELLYVQLALALLVGPPALAWVVARLRREVRR